MNYEELLKRGPYELGAEEKKKIYADMLSELTDSHRNRCLIYDRCCSALGMCREANGEKKKFPWFRYPCLRRWSFEAFPQELCLRR